VSTTSLPPDEPRNVLFIGSDRSDFEAIERFLFKDRQGPIRAHWAKKLSSALATLEKTRFAAILVNLPLLNYGGSGVLDAVRAAAAIAPIVVIAGAQSEPAARMALKRGAHDYLIKERLEARPFSHTLKNLIDRKSKAGAEMAGAGGKAATAARIAPQSMPSKIERRVRGRRAEDKLQEQNARLDAALANMPHGLCMFDADRRLVLNNSRYAEMYSLPPNLLVPGTSLESIIAYRNQIGNAPLDFPGYASHDGIEFKQEGNSLFEFMLEDGRTIRVNHLVLKDGGYVATHEDITKAVLSSTLRILGAAFGLAVQTRVQKIAC
jgi:PAS domain-containing protein